MRLLLQDPKNNVIARPNIKNVEEQTFYHHSLHKDSMGKKGKRQTPGIWSSYESLLQLWVVSDRLKNTLLNHLTWEYLFFSVIINIVREINKLPKVDFKDLIVTIQTARRMLSLELKNKNTSQMEVLEDEAVGNSKTDRQTQLAVDGRMAELYNAILHFELN